MLMLMADEYNTEAIGEKPPHYDTVPSRFSANELLKETGPKTAEQFQVRNSPGRTVSLIQIRCFSRRLSLSAMTCITSAAVF